MDGNKIHYDYEKISEKERTSYGRQGEYGIGGAISYYRRCKAIGADAITVIPRCRCLGCGKRGR